MREGIITFLMLICSFLFLLNLYNNKRGDVYYALHQENLEIIDQLYYTIEEMEANCTE